MSSQNERPVIFNSEMIKAILDGRKTQTRRIINPQPLKYFPEGVANQDMPPHHLWWSFIYPSKHGSDTHCYIKCPYGKVGDTLWVREDYWICSGFYRNRKPLLQGRYAIDEEKFGCLITENEWKLWSNRKYPYRKTSGRFMYKSIARIFLEVTNIRVERVQDIDHDWEDCLKEGVMGKNEACCDCNGLHIKVLWRFRELWDSINAKRGYGWDKNPWIWVVEFKKQLP